MNERINNLIDQTGFGSYAEIPDTYIVHKNDLVDFAKTIVRECAGIYGKIDNGNQHMGTDNYLEALHKTFLESKK